MTPTLATGPVGTGWWVTAVGLFRLPPRVGLGGHGGRAEETLKSGTNRHFARVAVMDP